MDKIKWYPIKNAPKDGTGLLLYIKFMDTYVIGFFDSSIKKWIFSWNHKSIETAYSYVITHFAYLNPPGE